MWFDPEPVAPGQRVMQYIRARDADTGETWSRLPLTVQVDNECVESPTGVAGLTGAGGVYRRILRKGTENFLQCVRVLGTPQPGVVYPPTAIAQLGQFIRTERYVLRAVPVRTAVPAGTNVNVNGVITPVIVDKELQLQRRYSDGVWRTVGTGRVVNGGKFTVVATPPGTATYSYRVYAPEDGFEMDGYSPVFTIRGT